MNADTKIPAHEQYAGIFAVYYIAALYNFGSVKILSQIHFIRQ